MLKIHQILTIVPILMSLLIIAQSEAQNSLLRTYQDKHNLMGIKGQWTGKDCDDQCHEAKGEVCGRIWKECCALGCQGVVQVTCKEDKFIPDSELKCNSTKNSQK